MSSCVFINTLLENKMANCIFGDQIRKQNNSTFHMCILFWYFCEISFGRDLGTEYIVSTAFQSYPTTKMSRRLLCGSPRVK